MNTVQAHQQGVNAAWRGDSKDTCPFHKVFPGLKTAWISGYEATKRLMSRTSNEAR